MRERANEKAERELVKNGWEYSHTATVNRYMCAGVVSEMRDRDGFHWCRVHVGRTVGKWSWQITNVYKKAM